MITFLTIYLIIGILTGIIFSAALWYGEKEENLRMSAPLAWAIVILSVLLWPWYWYLFTRKHKKNVTYKDIQDKIDNLEKKEEEES